MIQKTSLQRTDTQNATPKKHPMGLVLEKLMSECDITLNTLSYHTKVPIPTIARLKNDPKVNPTLASLLPIANYFDISVEQLIGREPLDDTKKGFFNPNARFIQPIPVVTLENLRKWHVQSNEDKKSISRISNKNVYISCTPGKIAFALLRNEVTDILFPKDALLIFYQAHVYHDKDFILLNYNNSNHIVFRQILIEGDKTFLKTMSEDQNIIPADNNFVCFAVLGQILLNYEIHNTSSSPRVCLQNL